VASPECGHDDRDPACAGGERLHGGRLASELLLVFAYLALRDRARVRRRDWAAAAGAAASLGISIFGERVRSGAGDLCVEALLLVVLVGSVVLLSRSPIVDFDDPGGPARRS
jgi:hypothetical protein